MVLLVNFAAPSTLDEVPVFLRNMTGNNAPQAVQEALVERYRVIGGGSPLKAITQEQADRIGDATGHVIPIGCVYRYSSPTLEEMINECYRSRIERIIFFVMSPYYTSRTVGGYINAVEQYLAYFSVTGYRPDVTFVHSWCGEPLFIDAWVRKIEEEAGRKDAFFIFSAHSLPRSLRDEPYVSQVEETVAAVAGRLNISAYAVGWQSVPAKTDEPWIGPTVEEVIDKIAGTMPGLMEIPIGFVSDHLETLYDMDIVHAGYARARGLSFSRISSLNTYPPFIAALKSVLDKHLLGGQ
jgi:protoporphyrin/coproporphyrin ferrochelatase